MPVDWYLNILNKKVLQIVKLKLPFLKKIRYFHYKKIRELNINTYLWTMTLFSINTINTSFHQNAISNMEKQFFMKCVEFLCQATLFQRSMYFSNHCVG